MSDSNNNNGTIRPDSSGFGNNNSSNNNNNSGGTIRPGSGGAPAGNSGGTIRPGSGGAPAGNSGGTIRPGSGGAPTGNSGGTIRPGSGGAPAGNSDGTIRPGSGGAPAGNSGGTIRPGNGAAPAGKSDGTLRPNGGASFTTGEGKSIHHENNGTTKGVADAAGAGASIAQADSKAVADVARTYEDSYVLNGIRYKVVKVISEGTGEAIVLLVENAGNQYVLKLYYEGISPNHAILDKVKSVRAMNLLVATVDHGVWCKADNKNGKDVTDADRNTRRDFELMLYYPYGSLEKLDIKGDEKRLCEFFAKMAMAINLCHTKGFLHRDVKPGNFLFTDKDQHSVVLGDFGIAVELGPNGVATTNQARTKVYAAPESYISTEGEVDITAKSDFYSLGMTLICLWMGEEQFAKQVAQSERALAKMKTYGKLPYPTGMSDHMLSLIMALTAPDPASRPDFEQIKEWISGKDPFLGFLGKKQQQEEKERGFEVLFNGAKNLVAHSLKELAQFMMADPELGTKYLYNGRVSKWTEEVGLPEVGADIEVLTEKKYPKDQQAGLYAACLTLDPEMPYTDVQDQSLCTSTEIADSLLRNFDTYKKRLANGNDELYIYMSMSGQEALAKQAAQEFKNSGISENEALRRLIYQLDPTRPYIIIDNNGKKHFCNAPDDIIRLSNSVNFDQESMKALYDEAFYTWLGARSKGLLAKVKKAVGELPSNSTIRFVTVLYNLNPKVSYYMELDPSSSDYIFTITQLAELFNHKLDEYQHEPKDSPRWKRADDMLTDINNIDDTLLYAYLKSKDGRYDKWIDWIRHCTNVKTKENLQKAGPYNWRLGTYKAIRGMGVEPYYRFPKSNKKITDPSELSSIPSDEIRDEMQNGMLADWLAVFYQEDPNIRYDQLPKYSFEQKCEEYTRKLGELDRDNQKYQDFTDAQGQVMHMAGQLKSTRAQLITLRAIVAVFCFLPIAGLIIMLLINGLPWTENPMPGWSSGAMTWMTLIFGVFVCFTGDVFDEGCITGLIAGAIGGFICALIVYYALYLALAFIMPFATYIIVALLLLLAWFIYNSCYRKPSLNISQNKGLFSPGFEETVLEPLDYAYNSSGKDFDSSILDTSTTYLNTLKEGRKSLFMRAIPTSIVTALLLFFFIQYIYGGASFGLGKEQDHSEQYQKYMGQWNGTFDGRAATIDVYGFDSNGGLSAVIHVKYRSLLQEMIDGNVNLETHEIFFDDKVSNDRLDGTYNGTVDDSSDLMMMSGTYTNKKSGKQVAFEFQKQKDAQENAPGTKEVVDRYIQQQEKATSAGSSSRSSRSGRSGSSSSSSASRESSSSSTSSAATTVSEEPVSTSEPAVEQTETSGGGGYTLEEVNPEDVPVDIE